MLNKFLPFIMLFSTVCNCPFLPSNKSNQALKTKKEDFIQQIKDVDCDDEDRFYEVQKLFSRVGAKDSEVEIEKFENVANIVVTVKGKTDEIVVVGGHFDKTTLGCGVIDNWTGIVLIANLYKNFKDKQPNKTFKFVAFGKEEKGLIGSKAMVKDIPRRDYKKHCAMVNFDSFGFTDVWTLESISDSSLINLGKEVAKNQGFIFDVRNYRGASSDSKSFQQKNIPAITLSGLGDNWREYLHQEKDQIENVNFDKVFDNLSFAYEFLNQIDARPCGSFR